MANYYVANSSGNLNTAATWDTVANVPTLHAASNSNVTTAGVSTDTFTAPNLVNSITGCVVFCVTYPSAGINWTAELYLAGAGTGNIATILQTDMPTVSNGALLYFRLAVPVVYTSLVAGTYKWVIKSTTANSGVIGNNAAATAVAVMSTDNRNTAPASTTDQIFILPPNCNTAITVTVDGTSGIVGGPDLASSARSFGTGVTIGGALIDSTAILKWDTSASSTLNNTGTTVITDGGELQMGTVASPYPSSFVATYNVKSSSGSQRQTYLIGTGKLIMQGNPLTYYKTNCVSGAGTAASPLIVSDSVNWSVGDKLYITATSNNATNYSENEVRYIITVNSATSYVVSTTKGGGESALTYTHTTDAFVLNVTRNVIYDDPGTNHIGYIASGSKTLDYVNIDWAELKQLGPSSGALTLTSNPFGLFEDSTTSFISADYCVFSAFRNYGLNNKRDNASYTNNIFYGGIGTGAIGGGFSTIGNNVSLTNCYFIDNSTMNGVEYFGTNCTFTNCYFNGNNTSGSTNKGGLYVWGGNPIILNNCEFHCNRVSGILLASTANSKFTGCNFGNKGKNQTSDIYIKSLTANLVNLYNCYSSSASSVGNYLNGASGATLIAFDTLNGTTNNHKWYTEYGSASSSGAGLADTTVRTSNTLNVRMAPEDSTTGFSWSYKTLAVPSKAVYALGFIQRNAAYAADTCLVELFLPGSTVADASYTMPTTVGTYIPFVLGATYNGTINRYATVKITCKTVTAAAYCYVADIFNGTNNITNLNTWNSGQPSPIIFEQLGDAAAVWAVPTSTLTTSGTTGNKLTNLLELSEFLGLK